MGLQFPQQQEVKSQSQERQVRREFSNRLLTVDYVVVVSAGIELTVFLVAGTVLF